MKKTILSLTVAGAVLFGASHAIAGSCSSCSSSAGHANAFKAKPDLVSAASNAGNFSTLVAAISAAELKETLQSDGPFTVFAPTDEAFAKLPAGTVESLLKPENKDQLVAILTYHVVPGKVMMKDVKAGEVTTVNGVPLTLGFTEGKFTADNSEVIATDIVTSNGVIHVIDTVMLPSVKTASLGQ